jgi:hypothetical protein
MQHLRNRRARRHPPNTITVEVTVEIHQEDTLSSLYDTQRPATPLFPVLPSHQSSASRHRPHVHNLTQSISMQEPMGRPFEEAALRIIARNEMRGFRHVFTLPTPTTGHAVFLINDAVRVIWADISGLLELGQQLTTLEGPREQSENTTAARDEIYMPVHDWMQSLEPLVCVDKPLFHMVCDALHAHTPQHIFLRWNALRT